MMESKKDFEIKDKITTQTNCKECGVGAGIQ